MLYCSFIALFFTLCCNAAAHEDRKRRGDFREDNGYERKHPHQSAREPLTLTCLNSLDQRNNPQEWERFRRHIEESGTEMDKRVFKVYCEGKTNPAQKTLVDFVAEGERAPVVKREERSLPLNRYSLSPHLNFLRKRVHELVKAGAKINLDLMVVARNERDAPGDQHNVLNYLALMTYKVRQYSKEQKKS